MRIRKLSFKKISLILVAAFAVGGGIGFVAQKVSENSASATASIYSNFRAGNIISDDVMSEYDSMSLSEIQSFLNSKAGARRSIWNIAYGMHQISGETYGYTTSSGNTYTFHVKDGYVVRLAEERFGDGLALGSGETAAEIIYNAAHDYRINPKVLLVLLQKEQALIEDGFPNNHQYSAAAGYACPDTGDGCSSTYAGFKTQVRAAADLFRTVLDGGWSNYHVGNNYIQWAPNSSCGGSTVYIENLATASLYRYTPYQPNAAALNTETGYGDSCSAYGNRNFYYYYTSWFGSTQELSNKVKGTETTVPDGYYNITAKSNSTETLTAWNKQSENGTNIELYSKSGYDHQTFKLTYSNGYYTITDTYSGKLIDVNGAKMSNSTNIQLWEPNSSCAQRWKLYKTPDGYFTFISACSNKYALDLHGGVAKNSANIALWDINNSDAQKWNLESTAKIANGTYRIVSSNSNQTKSVDIYGGATAAGSNISMWDRNDSYAQKWTFTYDAHADEYIITNPKSGKYLATPTEDVKSGTNVQLTDNDDTCANRWKAVQTSADQYLFYSACEGYQALDITNGSSANKANLETWEVNNADNQKWYLIPDETIPDGNYKINLSANRKYSVDVNGASTKNGTNVQLWSNGSLAAEKWNIAYNKTTGYYLIKNVNSNKYLDVTGAYGQSSTNVEIWSKNSSCAQKWRILKNSDDSYTLLSGCSQSLALDNSANNIKNGNNLFLWTTNSGAAQKWVFEKK